MRACVRACVCVRVRVRGSLSLSLSMSAKDLTQQCRRCIKPDVLHIIYCGMITYRLFRNRPFEVSVGWLRVESLEKRLQLSGGGVASLVKEESTCS